MKALAFLTIAVPQFASSCSATEEAMNNEIPDF